MVIKKDSKREPYDRKKLLAGIVRACYKRPISIDRMNEMVDEIETEIFNSGEKEIPTRIGEVVMDKLKDLDAVAYVRFASVYREFKDVNTFMDELKKLAKPYTEDDISKYYDDNADSYAGNGIEKSDVKMVNVRHILIQPEGKNDDGTYTFVQGDKTLTMGTNDDKFNLNLTGNGATTWDLEAIGTDGAYTMAGTGVTGKYGKVYMEYFLYTKGDNKTPEFSAYCTSADRLSEKDFGMTFYKLTQDKQYVTGETPDPEPEPEFSTIAAALAAKKVQRFLLDNAQVTTVTDAPEKE